MAPSHPPLAEASTSTNGPSIRGSSDNTDRISKKPPAKSKSKPKSTDFTASDRILTDVLLSIKPVHMANIISQQKNHEYHGVTRLWFYETGDGGRGRASITHVAVIPAAIRHTPGSVPTEPLGIGNKEFNAGFKESKYGYPVLELYELVHPVTLAEMKSRWGMGGAPMGWRYVERGLWEDRWGGDQDRARRVRQVF